MGFVRILPIFKVRCATDLVLLSYYVIIVEKLPFPVLDPFWITIFWFSVFNFSDHYEILPVGTLWEKKWISYVWRRHHHYWWSSHVTKTFDITSNFDDVTFLSKMPELFKNFLNFLLAIVIISTKFCEFSCGRSWFTEMPSFTDVVYLWRHDLKNSLVLNEKG